MYPYFVPFLIIPSNACFYACISAIIPYGKVCKTDIIFLSSAQCQITVIYLLPDLRIGSVLVFWESANL